MDNRTTTGAFAERVREASRGAGLTTLELSERTGISYTTLRRRLKSDDRRFTLDEIDHIADVTGAAFEWLITGHRQPIEVAS